MSLAGSAQRYWYLAFKHQSQDHSENEYFLEILIGIILKMEIWQEVLKMNIIQDSYKAVICLDYQNFKFYWEISNYN